jgi:hypothetical protein
MVTTAQQPMSLPQIAIVDINNYDNKATAIAQFQGLDASLARSDPSMRVAYFWAFDNTIASRFIEQSHSHEHILYQASQNHLEPLNKLGIGFKKISGPSSELSANVLWMDGPYAVEEGGRIPESTVNISSDVDSRSVIAIVYKDLDAVSTMYGYDTNSLAELISNKSSGFGILKRLLWNSAAEKIIFDKQKAEEAVAYVIISGGTAADNIYTTRGDDGKCYWTGPVHNHDSGPPTSEGYTGWMGGERHIQNANQPKLRRIETLNTTTHDYTVFERLSAIRIEESREDIHPNASIISPLCLTADKHGVCRGFFTINWSQALKRYVLFPNMVQAETRGLSKINEISIYRTNSTDGKERLVVSSKQIGSFETIADNTTTEAEEEHLTKGITKEISTGFIKELTNLLHMPETASGFRSFAMADLTTSGLQDGELTYKVEISFEDGTILLLSSLSSQLQQDYIKLNQYLSDYELSYRTGQHIKYDQAEYAGVWTSAAKNITSLLSYFGDFDIPLAQKELYLLTNPKSATIEGIERLLKLIQNKIGELHAVMSGFVKDGAAGSGETQANKTVSGNKSSSLLFLEHIWRNNPINIGEYNKHGYDYLNTSKIELSSAGLSTTSIINYDLLTNLETLKHFSPDSVIREDTLSINGVTNDLSSTKYSFLTPNFIKIPDLQIFETFNHINNRSVTLKSPQEYFNFLIDLISYRENGTIASSGLALTETEENLNEDKNKTNLKSDQVVNLLTQHLITRAFSFSGINVSEDYESEEYKALAYAGSNEEPQPKLELLGTDTVEAINSNAELEDRDTSQPTEKLFTSSLNASGVTFSLVENYLDSLHITKTLDCVKEMQDSVSIASLPNQYKAIHFSNTPSTTTTNWSAGMKNMNNIAFFHLMHKNISIVEVFKGYANNQFSPIWRPLSKFDVSDAAQNNKNYILCRLRREYNALPCPLPINQFLDIPVYNECFLISLPPTQTSGAAQPTNTLDGLDNDNTIIMNNAVLISTDKTMGGF